MRLEAWGWGRKKSVQRPKQGKLLWREQGKESVLEPHIGCVEGWWVGSSCMCEVVERLIGLGRWTQEYAFQGEIVSGYRL